MTAPAPVQTDAPASSPAIPLLPRQEAFCRYVADGLALIQAARMAGYAWDAARQHGSRLMKNPQVAARVAELVHGRDQQRRAELDELVGVLKRVMMSALSHNRDQSVLRAVEMIARLRGLTTHPARACGGYDDGEAANDHPRPDRRTASPPDIDPDVDPHPDPDLDPDFGSIPAADPNAVLAFTPPMPPELPAPVEAAPMPPAPDPADTMSDEVRAMVARARRVVSRMTRLMAAHPEVDMDHADESDLFFDDDTDTILPPDQWPIRPEPGKPLVRRQDLTAEQIARAERLNREYRRPRAQHRAHGHSGLTGPHADNC